MPNFWVALILIVVFVVALDWFPLSGMSTIGGPTDPLGRVLDTAWHLVLPVLTLSLTYMALYLRLMRGAMIETRSSGWVRAARARGLPSGRDRPRPHRAAGAPAGRHDARPPGRRDARAAASSSRRSSPIPGLGSLAYLAVQRRDLPLVAGVVLAGTVLVIVINLIVDISYARLDPRVADDRARARRPDDAATGRRDEPQRLGRRSAGSRSSRSSPSRRRSIAPGDPLDFVTTPMLPPLTDPAFPLGTDQLGRDVWAMLVHGARVSLAVGLAAAAGAIGIGIAVGHDGRVPRRARGRRC